MVKTGILRTFGEALRSWLATRLSNRFAGFAAGMGLAMLLQSSTAASLLVASLQAGGLVSTAAALAAVLGADLGSALAARILTLNISSLIPILLIAGTFLFLRRMEKREGQFGRMLLGFAFFWRCKASWPRPSRCATVRSFWKPWRIFRSIPSLRRLSASPVPSYFSPA